MNKLSCLCSFLFTEHLSMKAYWGSGCIVAFLTSEVYGDEWSDSRPGRFTPRKRAPSTHSIGDWGVPEPFWTRWCREKFPPPAGNRTPEPRSSSP
jgi:hypothetical protein